MTVATGLSVVGTGVGVGVWIWVDTGTGSGKIADRQPALTSTAARTAQRIPDPVYI